MRRLPGAFSSGTGEGDQRRCHCPGMVAARRGDQTDCRQAAPLVKGRRGASRDLPVTPARALGRQVEPHAAEQLCSIAQQRRPAAARAGGHPQRAVVQHRKALRQQIVAERADGRASAAVAACIGVHCYRREAAVAGGST